jgi:DoxX-like family
VNVTSTVLSGMLAAVFLGAGATKVMLRPRMAQTARHLGYSVAAFQVIGALEIAAAAALVAGVFWTPIGIAAAIGLAALLVGAAISHLRVNDHPRHLVAPAWLTAVSVATAITGIATL